MTSQEALLKRGPQRFPLLEEENPPEAVAGETKTSNVPKSEPQRDVVTYRDINTDFSVSTELVLCVHGWEKPDKKQAMTLLVFDYTVLYTKRSHFVKSVKTEFTFDEATFPATSRTGGGRSDPQVVGYAPFESENRWNETDTDTKTQVHGDAKIGVNQFANAELSGGGAKEVSHKQKYFTRGLAGPKWDNKSRKWNRVVWFLQQNDSQNDGVPSTFSVAILLKRESNANFKATFDIRLEAGKWDNVKSGIRRFFGMAEDEPVNFDPEWPEKGRKWEAHKDKISQVDLGALAKDGKLVDLVQVWGLDLGTFGPPQA